MALGQWTRSRGSHRQWYRQRFRLGLLRRAHQQWEDLIRSQTLAFLDQPLSPYSQPRVLAPDQMTPAVLHMWRDVPAPLGQPGTLTVDSFLDRIPDPQEPLTLEALDRLIAEVEPLAVPAPPEAAHSG